MVTSLLTHVEPGELRHALGSDVGVVAQVIPAIAELGVPVGVPPPVDPEAARFRAGQAVARFLCGVGDALRLVVVLEDIHWADLTSLQLLGFLADQVAGARVAVVATYRDADPLADDALRHLLGDLARRPAVRRHELGGLSDVDIGTCMATLGVPVGPELLTTIRRRTAGNPFFVTELLQLLPQDGVDLASVIPRGVRDVVRSRVAHLPDTTVEVAGAAAVLGQHFALAVLGQVLGVDGGTLLDQIQPAIAAGLVVEDGHGLGRYRFSHALVNETIYDDLKVGRRAEMHRRAGLALESRHGTGDGPHLAALAAHWYRAVPAASPDKGIEYAGRAATWAQAHLAWEQAEEQLRRALDLLAGMPDDEGRSRRELEVLDQLSTLLIMTSGYATPGLDEIGARMHELCRRIDDTGLLAHALWRLGIFYLAACELETAATVGGAAARARRSPRRSRGRCSSATWPLAWSAPTAAS